MITDSKIIITGGAGYLGRHLIERFYKSNEIVCYSRDEAKHYLLRKKYPRIKCVVGDVRDADRLRRAAKGCDIGIFAASLKQISACDENPSEANEVIIRGALNSRQAAEDNYLESAVFISSDKACAATTIYGACKFVAEQSFIVNPPLGTKLVSCRYGNVTNSTGSIIPLIKDALTNKYELELFSEEMTRFMLPVEGAIDLVERSLTLHLGGVVVPHIRSYKVKDLFEIYAEKFGLKYRTSSPRIGEKLHEVMISQEEQPRVERVGDDFIINPHTVFNNNFFEKGEYSSRDYTLSKEELNEVLTKENYYL